MKITHKRCYKEARRGAYPPIGDQVDAVYKLAKSLQSTVELPPEVQAWVAEIYAVKARYPK